MKKAAPLPKRAKFNAALLIATSIKQTTNKQSHRVVILLGAIVAS
jgi:hypothetical protein